VGGVVTRASPIDLSRKSPRAFYDHSKGFPWLFGTPKGDVLKNADPRAQEDVYDAGVSKGLFARCLQVIENSASNSRNLGRIKPCVLIHRAIVPSILKDAAWSTLFSLNSKCGRYQTRWRRGWNSSPQLATITTP